jgi:hypothetical protein
MIYFMNMSMQPESKLRKMLFNEGSFVISVVGLTLAVAFWVVNPQNELELELVKLQVQIESNQTVAEELSKIKNNDLHELQLRMDRIEARQIEELQAIARLEALLTKKQQ